MAISITSKISYHLHSPMSTPRKNFASLIAILSAVEGALALAAGIQFMGASTATLTMVGFAVPPIGLIVAGVAFMLFAAYLSLRVTCVTKIDDYVETETKQQKGNYQKAYSQFMKAKEALESSTLPSRKEARHDYDTWSVACMTSQKLVDACELYVKSQQMSKDELQLFENFHTENTQLLEQAEAALQKVSQTNSLIKQKAFNDAKTNLTAKKKEYLTASRKARAAYMNR